MRMYGFLKEPYKTNEKDMIYKIMIHKIKKQGVYVYLYTSPEAVFCSYDIYYEELEDVFEDWKDKIDEKGFIKIDDPQPYCQHDCVYPIRVKGRNTGNPQWGKYEMLQGNEWVDFYESLQATVNSKDKK